MKTIQIIGSGCSKCVQLTKNATEAATRLGMEFQVKKVMDINSMTAMGVMSTPALALDGKVLVQGKVASVEELEKVLH
jgi:small redox-active disulfide protein 2